MGCSLVRLVDAVR